MFISTIFASGLYVSLYMSERIIPAGGHSSLAQTPLIIQIQAEQEDATSSAITMFNPAFTPFPASAQFEAGDAWVSGGRRYRLYGLQACLRGTRITVANGMARDCGELNVIMIQAIIRDTRPVCQDVTDIDQNNVAVVCQTTTGERRYDLATYLIAQGWGFAAMNDQGQLIVPGYRIAEDSARSARAGLWASSDLPHPVSVLQQQGGNRR